MHTIFNQNLHRTHFSLYRSQDTSKNVEKLFIAQMGKNIARHFFKNYLLAH